MMSSSNGDNDVNLSSLERLIKEEQKQLEKDKLRFNLQRNIENIKKRRSDGNHNQPYRDNTLLEDKYNSLADTVDVNDQVNEKYTSTEICMINNPREEEINKLIDKISKPKENRTFSNNKGLRKSYPQVKNNFSQLLSPVDIREREKDQLSHKFASSDCPLTKPSCRQVAKNLNSSISFNDYKQNYLEKANDTGRKTRQAKNYHFEGGENYTFLDDREEYLRAKYNHPKIVISHYKESNKDEDLRDTKDNKMVRIGEFSPLNPNLPGGPTVLGLGDWDEKRQLLLQKYKQVSRSPSPSPSEGDHRHSQRSIATQTDLGDDLTSNHRLETSPHHLHHAVEKGSQYVCETLGKNPQNLHGCGHEDEERCCSSPQLRLSPLPKCFENMTEKEVKEFIYRQELEKQIEEKNKFKEEMKKREAEEEAKIEAKIQRDLEKMRRQYEEERLQRLELAIRKQEQEDLFRQRLAFEQQKALKESKAIKKQPVKNSALPNHTSKHFEKSTQSDYKRAESANGRAPFTWSSPERSAASVLSSVDEELRQPLLQPSSNLSFTEGLLRSVLPEDKQTRNTGPSLHKTKKSITHTSNSPPISVIKSKEVDIIAQKAVFDSNLRTSPQMTNITSFPSDTARDRLKEVDNMLKQPLLPESHRVLPPVSQPLLHATIPPLSASLQIPRGTSPSVSNRKNADVLEDKWKVPYPDKDLETAPNTKQNARILTQLGTFRRQLQEESLRMRQRVREDSP